MKLVISVAAMLFLSTSTAATASRVGITLRGSRASMERQNRIARAEAFSFLRTNRDVARFAGSGQLVPVTGNDDYQVVAGWPYARPVVRDFVELLAREYHADCGEPLVVTSLTRPSTRQPENASPLSVHPAGMAVDLRVSRHTACVRWLEGELLRLESLNLLDGTREYHPPHFHVAVFPDAFNDYLTARAADSVMVAQARADSLAAALGRELAASEAAELAYAPRGAPAAAATRRQLVLLGDLLSIVGRLLLRV